MSYFIPESLRVLRSCAVWVVAIAPAYAGDGYVDAQNGNDANSGQSPAAAWKTLTHAVATLPSSPGQQQLIHAAPGVYDVANGESYPLEMKPGFRIVGDMGSAATILDWTGFLLLDFNSNAATTGYSFDASSGADGLTLRNSTTAILCATNANPVSPSFHDLVIQNTGTRAVNVWTYGFNTPFSHPTFDHVTVTSTAIGFQLDASGSSQGTFSTSIVDLTDCVVSGCSSDGILLDAAHGTAKARLVRCRITGNGNGVAGTGGPDSTFALTARATLIAGNGLAGVTGSGSNLASEGVTLTDCTIVNNSGVGVQAIGAPQFFTQTTLDNCILFGNGDDLAATAPINASYCDCGDGDLNGYVGCFAADPLFVNAAAGDYRLRFGSPCIDVGDPIANGRIDLLGHARPFDGDLDTQAAPDMGAYEFEPLHQFGSTSIGHQFGLELWGASGSMSQLLLSKQPLAPPQSTPFGDFYLAPGTVIALGTLPAQPGPPFFLRRTLPNDASLIGTTFSFQALTDSAIAPQGQAYTNPTSFVVMP
jgi:hypothetical protein